jgi:gliding motility-associated-like protein
LELKIFTAFFYNNQLNFHFMKKITLLIFAIMLSLTGYGQFSEGFESANVPNLATNQWDLGSPGLGSNGIWGVFDNGVGLGQSWNVNANAGFFYEGLKAGYMNRENIGQGNTAQDYLATPAVTIPANGQLRFFTRSTINANQGTIYKIMVAPATANQDDPAAYTTTVQQWTENELSASFNIYEEKVVNLTAFIGQQVYVAFVMEFTQPTTALGGDRWLIDRVRIVEKCADPTALTAGTITQTSALLSWGNPSGATQWEIEIIPFADAPTGTGIVINNNPYLATATTTPVAAFTPTTQYKYYVRSLCGPSGPDAVPSAWAGPFAFATSSPGLTCASPIVIGSTPYTTTDNTANYSDSTDVTQPAACAGTATNYMTGNDVFYSYTPTADGAISITMTPTGNWSGIFVYDGCANVGVTCVAGVANTGGGPRLIPTLPVIAGHQYIIVISTNATPQTVGYTMQIQTLNCAPPTGLTASGNGPNEALLSWDAGVATSWEVFVQTAGSPLPSTAGITANTNTNFSVTTLNDGTPIVVGCYQYWARAACGDGTFSPWTGPYQFCTLNCTTSCTYNFVMSDSFGDGWNGNTMTITQGTSTTTIGSTFTTGTGPITIPVALCDGPFTLTWNTGGSFANEVAISIANSFGQTIYTHASGTNQQGQVLYTGTVDCANPLCLPPTNLVFSAVTTNGATLAWTPNGPASGSYNIYAVPTGSPAPTAATVPTATTSSNPYTIGGLLADTAYTYYVNAVCSGTQTSAWSAASGSFTTLPTCPKPTALSVAGIDQTQATFNWTPGGTETAWQVIVLPVGSPAPTPASPWIDAPTHPFTVPGLTAATAYVFYVRAICSPADASTPAGPLVFNTTICPAANQCLYSFVMTDSFGDSWNGNTMSVQQNGITVATLTGPTNADDQNPVTVQVPICNGVPFTLVWNTGGTFANEVGISITSFLGEVLYTHSPGTGAQGTTLYAGTGECIPPTCLKPTNVIVTNMTLDSAIVSWTDNNTPAASSWDILVLPATAPPPAQNATGWINVGTNPYTLTGLTAATSYKVYVRSKCSDTDSSFWSVGTQFSTVICLPSNLCEYTFVMVDSFGDSWNGNTMNVTQNGIVVATLTGPTNADDQNAISQIVPLCNNIPFELFWNAGGNFANEVGISIVNTLGVTIYNHTPGTGAQNTQLFSGTVTCVPVTCPKPVQLTVSQITSTSALLGWTEAATATAWQVLILPFGSPAPLPGATGWVAAGVNPILITGLAPGTHFTYYVRAVCSDTDLSNWSAPMSFSTLPANDECSGAIFVPVNSNSSCNQAVSGTLAGATTSAVPLAPCVGTADDDIWFQFVASNSYLNISINNVVGAGAINHAVYSGSCSGLSLLYCSTVGDLSTVANGLIVGQTYYIRVFSNGSTPVTNTFDLCISTPSTCSNSSTVCNTSYTNTTGVANLGQIGCLFTSPNPRYFTIQVISTGPINYLLTQGTTATTTPPNLDVDYAAWGPFTSPAQACTVISPDPNQPPIAPTAGCSYSAAATENWTIPNAQAGQYYVILITNFSDDPGVISLTQTNATQPGAGVTFCCEDPNFSYAPTAFCNTSTTNPIAVIAPGALAGTFTALPAGLVFVNTATGEIDLAASAPNTYVVTNTLPATGTCNERHYDFTITISAPVSATISYGAASYCSNNTTSQPVVFTGTTGGSFSVAPAAGLFINPTTGAISPSQSAPGIYTVNYNILSGGACASTQPSTQVEIINAPEIPVINDVIACDSYTLPALTVGNYFTDSQANGGVLLTNNVVTTNQTVYVYAVNSICSDETSFAITINQTPVIDPIDPVATCTSYTLPVLAVGNYFTDSHANGGGTMLAAGTVITADTTLYVYAENGTCSDEESFTITFGDLVVTTPGDQSVCSSTGYTLPALTLGDYYTDTQANGGVLIPASTVIMTTQTIWVYATSGTCFDEQSFTVTVNSITADDIDDVVSCTGYTLLPLSAGNTYWTLAGGPAGGGTQLFAGDVVTTNQTVYVYAETGTTPNCVSESDFTVTIGTIDADELLDVTSCDSYTLPALSANNTYWTLADGPAGGGTQLFATNVITTSQTIHVYAQLSAACVDESDFAVTINITPVLAGVSPVTVCDSYTLPTLAVGNYYDGPDGTGNLIPGGTVLTAPFTTVYVYAQSGTAPNACPDSDSFTVTINPTPDVAVQPAVNSCGAYELPVLTVGNYFEGTAGSGTQHSAGEMITTDITLYVYASNGACSDEETLVINIGTTPEFTIGSGCDGSNYVLTVQPVNFTAASASYAWSASNGGDIEGFTDGQSIIATAPGDYSVTVTSDGCPSTLPISPESVICDIQKGVSANHDGTNDTFDLAGQDVSKLEIFNRYGLIVYHRNNYIDEWHGQSDKGDELPDGTYYYVIDRGAGETITGWIYLSRMQN